MSEKYKKLSEVDIDIYDDESNVIFEKDGEIKKGKIKEYDDTELREVVENIAIPTKVSQLENDSGYLTEHQDISDLASHSYVDTEVQKVNVLTTKTIGEKRIIKAQEQNSIQDEEFNEIGKGYNKYIYDVNDDVAYVIVGPYKSQYTTTGTAAQVAYTTYYFYLYYPNNGGLASKDLLLKKYIIRGVTQSGYTVDTTNFPQSIIYEDNTETINVIDERFIPDKYATKEELSQIPRFNTQVVDVLPTENISNTTIYLVRGNEQTYNEYEEWICVNNTWEKIGGQSWDVSIDEEELDAALEEVFANE